MRRLAYLIPFVCLVWIGTARADFTNPATLRLTEVSPAQFEVVLTLPLIRGRVLKAKPILPDICVIKGDLDERGVGGSVIRTWKVACNPDDLVGAPIGVAGLLGTSQDIQLTIETLDGRKYIQPLLPTQSFYVIPPPPTVTQLALAGSRKGIELVLLRPELVLLIVLSGFLAWRKRAFVAAILAFSIAQALGQWLASQNWMVMSPFMPRTLTALTALLIAYEIVRRPSATVAGWHRPLWIVMLLLGLLYGAAQPEAVARMGLSRVEHSIAFGFVAIGAIAGLTLLVLCVRELRAVLIGFFETIPDKLTFWIGYLAGVVACALFLYELSTPAFIGGTTPLVPMIALITAVVLGIWGRLRSGLRGSLFAMTAGVLFAFGIVLSFKGIALPLTTLVVFGVLAYFGATLVFPIRWPTWLVLPVVGLAAGYHGYFAAQHLRDSTSLPVANAIGMMALLAFLLYACYRTTPGNMSSAATGVPVRVFGTVAAGLAILWRLVEYREWLDTELAAEVAMGLVRLPVLAVILLLLAGWVWPRKRRFKAKLEGSPQVAHWVLLAVAFFTFPLGTWRVHNPFYTPRAPTALEAKPIMSMLLTDTYLAFNLTDEDTAFDRLARNLSQNLVADVYLDSRRRLTAGTRKGAEVTVKDVSVMSVDEATSDSGDQSFTYPCKWVVTARVKHWQHIHNRQNRYVGTLTIRVEKDRWKISNLELLSEEREILSWKKS